MAKLILICDKCYTAACWYGEFMCGHAHGHGKNGAGLLAATKQQLAKLGLESSHYWSDDKLREIYGTTTPNTNNAPRFYRSMLSK